MIVLGARERIFESSEVLSWGLGRCGEIVSLNGGLCCDGAIIVQLSLLIKDGNVMNLDV